MTPAAPTCAHHPATLAAFTCTRCGSFSCEGCRSPTTLGLCTSCDARATGTLSAAQTLREGLALVLAHPRIALACGLAYGLLGIALLPLSLEMAALSEAMRTPGNRPED